MVLSGYTLPVFACAGAIAALRHLFHGSSPRSVSFNLLTPDETAQIPIDQVARLSDRSALAISRSDPGEHLDLTRDTPIWSLVELDPVGQAEAIALQGGEGIGIQQAGHGPSAIYRYAQQLLHHHLETERQGHRLRVTIILPEGRALAERTSNAAFGVVDGLSLLGTGGIVQPLTAPDQLDQFRQDLRQQATQFKQLVFCIGENGLDLAPRLGFPPERRVKTANWLGPLLVEAALQGVEGIILLGYHGKLIKLAGGIFHTHHHIADGRQEILTAIAAHQGLPTDLLQQLYVCTTVEAGLTLLREFDLSSPQTEQPVVHQVYGAIAQGIDQRAQDYIYKHCGDSATTVRIGSILFDRQRQIIVKSAGAIALTPDFV